MWKAVLIFTICGPGFLVVAYRHYIQVQDLLLVESVNSLWPYSFPIGAALSLMVMLLTAVIAGQVGYLVHSASSHQSPVIGEKLKKIASLYNIFLVGTTVLLLETLYRTTLPAGLPLGSMVLTANLFTLLGFIAVMSWAALRTGRIVSAWISIGTLLIVSLGLFPGGEPKRGFGLVVGILHALSVSFFEYKRDTAGDTPHTYLDIRQFYVGTTLFAVSYFAGSISGMVTITWIGLIGYGLAVLLRPLTADSEALLLQPQLEMVLTWLSKTPRAYRHVAVAASSLLCIYLVFNADFDDSSRISNKTTIGSASHSTVEPHHGADTQPQFYPVDGVPALPQLNPRFTAPLVSLSFAGGGSRAAIFSGLCLKRLYFRRIELSDNQKAYDSSESERGPSPKSEIDLASTEALLRIRSGCQHLPELESWLFPSENGHYYAYPGRLLLLYCSTISSISGGSLTSAVLQSGLNRAIPDGGARSVLITRMHAFDQFFRSVREQLPDNTNEDIQEAFSSPVIDSSSPKAESYAITIERDPFIHSLNGHFLSAVVNGAFMISRGRRQMITEYWNHAFDWQNIYLSSFSRNERTGTLPIELFGTTLANTGERLVFSNLNFEKREQLFRRLPTWGNQDIEDLHKRPFNSSDVRAIPGLPIMHRDFGTQWDPLLADVVWASSDFPFGFSRQRFKDVRDWSSLDGGVIDNTGLDLPLSMIRALAVGSENPEEGGEARNERSSSKVPQAGGIWNKSRLGRLGCLILAFDSSEVAVDSNDGNPLFDNLSGTWQAMWRAARLRDAMMYAGYLADLQRYAKKPPVRLGTTDYVYGHCSVGAGGNAGVNGFDWGLFVARAGSKSTDHVATTWHLAPSELRKLIAVALDEHTTRTLDQCAFAFARMTVKNEMSWAIRELNQLGSPF